MLIGRTLGDDVSSNASSAGASVTAEETSVRVARTIIQNVAAVKTSKQKSTLKKILGQIDPTLYDRTKKEARALHAQGMAPNDAVLQGLARAYLAGSITELHGMGQIALAAQGASSSSGVSGLGGLGEQKLNTGALQTINQLAATAPSTTVAEVLYWPYSPTQNEQVIQVGQVSSDGTNMNLPQVLTLPLTEATLPINTVPQEYAWLADVLDQATTLWEPSMDWHQDSGQSAGGWTTCRKGTRFYWQTGVDLSRTPLGPYIPTIDGGHSVPMLRELLQDPYPNALDSQTGNPCCSIPNMCGATHCSSCPAGYSQNPDGSCGPGYTPGIPLFLFTYPGTSDTWGVFLIATDVTLNATNDTYVPNAWADKAATVGPPVQGRLAATKLAMRSRKLTQDELDRYNSSLQDALGYADHGCGFSLTGAFSGLGWFLEEIGKLVIAIIKTVVEVAAAVAEAVGVMACQLLQQPGGAGAIVKAAGGGVTGGAAIAAGAGLAAITGCSQPPPMIVCSAGQAIDPTTGQCASTTPWGMYLLIGAGALAVLVIAKKKKPVSTASPS